MLQNAKILIIEDDADTAEAMEALCRELGHKPVVAHDGLQGLELANRVKPELILSDIAMPGEDGISLLQQMRATRHASVPAIAVTAYADHRSRERVLGAGFEAFVSKPIDPHEFASVVDRVVRARTQEQALKARLP